MNFAIISFCVSLAIIIFMIGLRSFEIRIGKAFIPSKLRFLADDLLSAIWFAISENIVRMLNWISRELSLIPRRVKMFLALVWKKIRDKVDSYFGHFHHHDLNDKGSVSVYWKSISDHQKE